MILPTFSDSLFSLVADHALRYLIRYLQLLPLIQGDSSPPVLTFSSFSFLFHVTSTTPHIYPSCPPQGKKDGKTVFATGKGANQEKKAKGSDGKYQGE